VHSTAYQLALFTRGTGAYAYSYSGSAGLLPGQVAAATFRGRIELGVIIDVDPQPPVELLPLWPVRLHGAAHWGALLLELCEMTGAAPDELAGHLLFAAPAAAVRLELSVRLPHLLQAQELASLGQLAGALTPGKRALLARTETWRCATGAARQAAVVLEAVIAGTGSGARSHPRWRKWYSVDQSTLQLWGLPEPLPAGLPGSYLAGLAEAADFSAWPVMREAPQLPAAEDKRTPVQPSNMAWEALDWPLDWDLTARWSGVRAVPLRRVSSSWAGLRAADGLLAELARSIVASENILLIAPQSWMLDRIWPMLASCATRAMRYRPDGGASAAGHILRQLSTAPGQVVAGLPGAWKLAAYGNFQRVLLLDPSHPQYAPERYPGLDPRLALLLALSARCQAGQPAAGLDMVDLGLSAWDGRGIVRQVELLDAFDPPPDQPRPGGRADTNPLPLALRQPGRRRLVYFNRLGSSRGLRCTECQAAVACPACRSPRIHFSAGQRAYACPQCGYTSRELRCASCGLATLAAQLPGLEAVTLRPVDQLVQGAGAGRNLHAGCETVLGTSQLLDPLAGFWPQDIVYVHADARVAQLDDWPQALDMAARLAALYANPELRNVYIVSDRLRGQLGTGLNAAQLGEQWLQELNLRRLAGLPPYGCIYKLQLMADSRKAVALAREQLGRTLQGLPDTRLLRLGRPYEARGHFQLAGFFINPSLSPRELQELRWRIYRAGARLNCVAIRGPWL
jgi:hypothetical protein